MSPVFKEQQEGSIHAEGRTSHGDDKEPSGVFYSQGMIYEVYDTEPASLEL